MAARKKSNKSAEATKTAEPVDPREPVDPTGPNLERTLTRIRDVLAGIEPPAEPRQGDFVDATMHLVLARGLPCGYANESMRRIEDEFVDRNELRVTEAYEVEELLADLEIPDLFDRCKQLQELVGQIYNDQNGVDLGFLREATVTDRNHFFQRVPAFDPELTAHVSNLIAWDEVVFSPRSTQRVQTRLGLDPKNSKVESFVEGIRAAFAPYGHLPLTVGAEGKNGKPALEPELCPTCLLLRLAGAKNKKR